MKVKVIKTLIKIVKISCLSVFSAFIIFQVFILINANKIAQISAEIAAREREEMLTELQPPAIPMASVKFPEETTENITVNDIVNETAEPGTAGEPPNENEGETSGDTEFVPPGNENENNEDGEPVINYTPGGLLPKNMPVFMYHTSSENNPGYYTELYVRPSEFEKQVQYLFENGFTFCTFDDYYNLNDIDKPVFITFDDGYKENYTEIFPILQKYNAKITVFLMLNHITDSNITRDMIVEMSDSGLVKFESHTVSHPSLPSVGSNEARLVGELRDSKFQIEEITGKPVLALAYPNGEFNETVKEKTKEFYAFGLRKDLGMHNTEYDSYEVRRFRINRSTNLTTFISYLG